MSDNLYAPLRTPRPACTSNACGQDSRRCKTRQACELPIDDDLGSVAKAIALAVLLPLTLVIAAGGGAWLLTVLLDAFNR